MSVAAWASSDRAIFRICPLAVAATVVLAGLPFEPDLFAQTAPPPIIVPQVTPRFNDPSPQLTIPKPASPIQQPSSLGTGSQIVPAPRHHAAKHRHIYPAHSSTDLHTAKKGGRSTLLEYQ
jgi:hypothetical protein